MIIDFLFVIGAITVILWMIGSAIYGEIIVKKFEEDDWWPYRKKDDDE
tara:strand:- start:517 stop:660 length:144 start_codon:yes stop_codon:yes gene_type:complete